MRKIRMWLAALMLPACLAAPVAVQAVTETANAAVCNGGASQCGKVGSYEFWQYWGATTASQFEDSTNAQAFGVDDLGGGEYARHYYAKTETFTRTVSEVIIHTTWNGSHNIITDATSGSVWPVVYGGNGGKAQNVVGSGYYTYPVRCQGAPC